jgi:hypothetical protein
VFAEQVAGDGDEVVAGGLALLDAAVHAGESNKPTGGLITCGPSVGLFSTGGPFP